MSLSKGFTASMWAYWWCSYTDIRWGRRMCLHVSASYSILLACILLSTLWLILRIQRHKRKNIWHHTDSQSWPFPQCPASLTPYPGAIPSPKPNRWELLMCRPDTPNILQNHNEIKIGCAVRPCGAVRKHVVALILQFGRWHMRITGWWVGIDQNGDRKW